MKRLIVSSLCVLMGIFFLMSSKVYANESVNDLIQDPNKYLVFSTFSAFPNVPEIIEDPNDKTFITSFSCYGCHQARHILDPSDPNNNLWREAGAAPIYGDQVDGIEITNNKQRRNHHPMGAQARLTGSIFMRAPGEEATKNLNKNREITCISCHADFHGVIDGKDYDQSKENNFLRWDFTNDNAEFCIKCHSDKIMVNDGKHFWNTNSPVTRKVFSPNAPGQDFERQVYCKQCMFCHFIHDGEERDNEGIPNSIRADIDALMRIGPENLAWGDRTNDTDSDDYEDMCYGCHGVESIVGGYGNAGSLLDTSRYFTHPFAIEPQTQIGASMFPVSDGNSPAVLNDYGSKEGQIFCGTCHDVHRATNRPYLRSDLSPYEAYGFCEECHDKDGQFVSKSHPMGVGPNDDPAQGALTGAEFVDTYNSSGPLFSQGGSGKPGGITSPYDPVTGKSTLGGRGKVVCLTCHNVHAAVTSWEGSTKNDSNKDHGHLLVKDNMREREPINAGSELCKACHSFGDSEYSFPEGAHGGRTFSHGRGICSACHIPHGACEPKLWAIECPSQEDPGRGCYGLGPFKGIRQLCFCCHSLGYILPGSKTVFKGFNLGATIPPEGYYPEDHVMRYWADKEGVEDFDTSHFPLDTNARDTIPAAAKPDQNSHDGFYCGSCHNPHLHPDKNGGYYLRSKDGHAGNLGRRREFCDDCHINAHDNEEEKYGECLECHHPHGGLTRIDEDPFKGRLILITEFSDIMPPKITGQYPPPGDTEVYPNTNIIFHIEDPESGVDMDSIKLFVQGINLTDWLKKEDEAPDKIRVIYDPPFSFLYGESVQVLIKAHDLATPFNAMDEEYQFTVKEPILSEYLTDEGCWQCHQDMYPDLALNPNSPAQPNLLCFTNPMGLPNPLYYSTLEFEPNKNFFDLNPSENFTNGEIYKYRKKGHLTHLVYQPFGLGRWCLDCHDPERYTQADPNTPHLSDHNVYFKDGEKLDYSTICLECHGGFYPKENIDPNIDNKLKILQWDDPGSVTCLQCHDDSYENGGIYASYISRYCSFPNWHYNDDPNGCLITAPDPDKVPGQNYWPKSGHGVTAQKSYPGATLDTGYPDADRTKQFYPNSGAMNSNNIPINPNDPNRHSNIHDLDLDPADGRKNYCWECHWSNETVRKKGCVESIEFLSFPDGFPIGKYNGHLDTAKYRDERWGAVERLYPDICLGHKQWDTCRECHPTKYSHFVYKELGSGRRKPGPIDRFSHCIVCHNPHGSGDEHGNVNVFMIKGRIYKQICNNCHYSQFRVTDCDMFADLHVDTNKDTWVINFFDPLVQDIIEPDSSENSIPIPASTKDICEVCHQDKLREEWPNPGDPDGDKGYDYKHRNGSRHYFNPDDDPCPDSNTCIVDYRGTDCTGCHIHDPGPAPDPDDPDYYDETSNSRSVFNSKAFAPTCRCHGIGRIDIAPFTVDGNQPVNSLGETLFGKGHGTPPPPFPDGDTNQDPHMAHGRYNFPCIACHIDPDGPLYDPNVEYIFDLDDYTPVGINKFMDTNDRLMNPNGIYERSARTCSNLYCHSNAKGIYADPISWSEADKFCRDISNPDCFDAYGRFLYCNECHKNPPDDPNQSDPNNPYNITDHTVGLSQPDPNIRCSTCHPHNGLYKEQIDGIYVSNSGFYKHVDGKVDISEIIYTFDPIGCGYCHKPDSSDLDFHDPNVPANVPIEYDFPRDSCLYCHSKEHKEMILCDPNIPDIDLRCTWCHQETLDDPEPDFECDSDKKWLHSADAECTSCHSAVCDPNTIHHYEDGNSPLPLSIEQNWNDGTGCGACHNAEYLTNDSEKTSFIKAKDLHNRITSSTPCSDCHGKHCALDIDTSDCTSCHIPQEDVKVRQNYLHDRYTGLTCTDCHSSSHKEGEMTFTEGKTQGEIEGKCIICHDADDLNKISVSCDLSGNHKTRDNCLNCHNVFTREGNIYKIIRGHYEISDSLMEMEEAWSDIKINDPDENHCGVCHEDRQNPFNPSKKLHELITSTCSVCHGDHCDMNILPGWTGDNTCGGCHTNGDVILPGGQPLHAGIPSGVSCLECHPNHRDADSLRGYIDDSGKCGYCHGDPPGINVLCNGISVNGAHPPQATNCQACHPGVYNKMSHYLDAGPINVIQSWEGPNSCGICHRDLPVALCAAGPFSIHATLGPGSNCAQCHGNHCDMIYGDTPAKCIACHSPNPAICDICGPGSITSHYAFDSMGLNQASIQDCLSCHVEPLGGGEANPLEHIDNPRTFVKEGACLGCHSLAIIRHGSTDPRGCYACHPMHCVTEYARNDACIWCHTTNPPIVDICKMGIGITSHLAFDSSAFNQIQITNCIGCHVEPMTGGEANPINHIDNPMTYVNPLTCIGCHTVVVPHGGSGLPWGGGVWPAVNCYSCHPTHCISTYCDNQACVWCHTDAPLLLNVCGKPGLVPHTGDCIGCHAGGSLTGGECNPADHTNGLTFVRDGTCLGCHANVIATHGPGTEICMLCHPVHCSFAYCSEPQCKLCHNQPAFEIVSDYGCGIGPHDPPAYKECNRCHAGECNPQNHTLGPMNPGMPTDLSGMRLEWRDCGLCHSEAQAYHAPCNAPCTLCHSGTSIHACLNLDYCAENKCKCCHASPTFPIQSDYGCGVGQHAAGAYINCSLCHTNECNALNHMDRITDVSNMPLDWQTCGLCHMDARVIHEKCNQPCTACHSGTGNHACLDLNYCAEPQCKCCHADPVFPINSDYGCGTGPHSAQAYVDCTMCHIQECTVTNHIDGLTDVSNMPLNWTACGLCHVGAQASHVNCPEPCTLCHSGTGNHSCVQLDYCTEIKCKCCHLDTITINSDYGCGTGPHPTAAYVDCTMCHIGECVSLNHMDSITDVSNMPLNWPACGLCHVDAQAIHVNCPEPCTLCHTGTSNHSCLELDYCAETKCKCCHLDTITINSDYGCGTGPHATAAYVDCTMCHIGECTPGNHLDTITDVSNMPLTWSSCGLCHANAQASHANCPETCTLCHSGTSPHACLQLDYCADQKCRCCHIDVPLHFNTPCDCSTCHSAECDPLEHDITGVSTSHPMDPLYYNYTGTINDKGCTCCHPYPPQCVCVGISDTQDHCLDLANGCSPQIYDCMPCHTLFNGQPTHIYTIYGTPATIASCACHGDSLGTTGAHSKHLTTPVMVPVYGTATGNVIDCQACHSSTTNLADHVVCIPGTGLTAPVQFDAALPMIGLIDSYTPGATPGTGSCNLYCHSDGDEDPLDVPGTYIYFLGAPPLWNQTTGIISCGNTVLGTTAVPIYQCHGYPPPTHPGGAGGGAGAGIQNCTNCHPTPLLGTAPDNTVHINGALEVTGGGFGPGGAGGPGGGGVGGGIPVI